MPRVRIPANGVKGSLARETRRRATPHRLHGALGALAFAWPGVLAAQTADLRTIEQLYDPRGPQSGTQAVALSGDGRVAVGTAWPLGFGLSPCCTTPERQAFRWTAGGGTRGLGFLPGSSGNYTVATAVSRDGSVVVGSSSREAFRWTAAGGMQGLGFGGVGLYSASSASGVSADGSIIVGTLTGAGARLRPQAFRWTEAGGLEGLGFGSFFYTDARAVSGDGRVIVGGAGGEAFRWTVTEGMRGLGTVTGPAWHSAEAQAVSFDGSVIAGRGLVSSGMATQGFVWSAEGGMLPLGFLSVVAPGNFFAPGASVQRYSDARAISADGGIIVGTSGLVSSPTMTSGVQRLAEAFRWSAAGGMQSIPAALRAAGVDLGATALEVATGITTTGPGGTNIILGYTGQTGSSAYSWIVRLPDPRAGTGEAGFITPEALLGSLGQVPSAAATAERLVWSAQREALLLAEQYGGTLSAEHPVAGFIQARGGGWDPADEWGTALGGAAGVIMRVGAAARAGFVVSATAQNSQGGTPDVRSTVDGAGARLFALVGDTTQGPRLGAAFGYDQLWATIRRRYADGGSTEAIGRGKTNGQALAASLRGAWGIPFGAATTVSPFVGFNAVSTRLAAYDEGAGSGAFPARFNTQRQTGTAAGMGVEVEYRFGGGSRVWGNLGYNHRLSGDSSAVSGSFVDLFAFDLRGLPVAERNWVEGVVGGAWAISPGMQLVGALGGTLATDAGGRYSVFSSLGLVVGF